MNRPSQRCDKAAKDRHHSSNQSDPLLGGHFLNGLAYPNNPATTAQRTAR